MDSMIVGTSLFVLIIAHQRASFISHAHSRQPARHIFKFEKYSIVQEVVD